jgi:hypothetical protein
MHIVSLIYCVTLDVDKLIKLSIGKLVVRRGMKRLQAHKLSRSRRSGFSHRRYRETDVRHPVLITTDDVVLDGRHRLCKLYDMGRKFVNCVVLSDEEIVRCRISTKMT